MMQKERPPRRGLSEIPSDIFLSIKRPKRPRLSTAPERTCPRGPAPEDSLDYGREAVV
jgi:hypothetical protein